MATRIIPDAKVQPVQHPNAGQLNPESVEALATAKANMGSWVVWQSGFPHHRASKVQAYNLRNGKRQKSLTEGLLDDDGDERLEFKAYKDPDSNQYCVIARYTDAEFRIHERENLASA